MKIGYQLMTAVGCIILLAGCNVAFPRREASPFPTGPPPANLSPTSSPYPLTPADTNEIEQYYGKPQAATLIVNQQEQKAGIGTITWIERKSGDETVQLHGDAFGIVTPAQPLGVASPFSAELVLPVHIPPTKLAYVIYPVMESDRWGQGSGEMETWNPPRQTTVNLPLEAQQTIDFNVTSEGLHILYIDAEWKGLGSIDYGFLLEIKHE